MIDMKQHRAEKVVSIIVPVYNCGNYIEKCLQSIINQSYELIEIIVVNDGSTDNSEEIISKFAQTDSRVQQFQQSNQGVSAARNYALKYATGDYYLFVDADDYIGKDYVKNLVECANSNQSELVISGFTLTYTDKSNFKVIMPGQYEKDKKEDWAYRLSSAWGRLYSSEFWNKNNLHFVPERDAGGEDVPIALFANAMARNVQVIRISEYFYVQREGSAMNSKKKVIFGFPYVAFEEMYNKIQCMEMVNSKAFFDMGIIKFLAMFKYVIYFKADKAEKKKFKKYVHRLLDNKLNNMKSEWKMMKRNIDLPVTHKMAISIFLMQMGKKVRYL